MWRNGRPSTLQPGGLLTSPPAMAGQQGNTKDADCSLWFGSVGIKASVSFPVSVGGLHRISSPLSFNGPPREPYGRTSVPYCVRHNEESNTKRYHCHWVWG